MSDVKPLRSGADVSWIPLAHPGDDQGKHGACSVFAIASWAECMFQTQIADQVCIDAYTSIGEQRYGLGYDGGLSIPVAMMAAYRVGIIPSSYSLRRVPDIASLPLAPIIAEYETTRGWDRPNKAGCIDHTDNRPAGLHAVLIVAHGNVMSADQRVVWVENSWGASWGWNGFGQMTEAYHTTHIRALWQIMVPGRPTTMREYEQRQLEGLTESIRDYVRSIVHNLGILGYSMPVDSSMVMADIVRRSLAGYLTDMEQLAQSRLADAWLILRQRGVTDEDIIAVWETLS